ncbi:Pyrrolidone-carboxylate peptidase [Serratia liquefaciens]|nr:Pyrrolidone-carboxylate peptidase [Serratia liquefaciens]
MAGVLITGFEPFGGETVNPSWEVVKQLDGMIIRGQQVVAKQLPCVFGEALTVLKAALETYQPRLTIAVGQAGGRVDITVERVAINVDDARIPTIKASNRSTSRSSLMALRPASVRYRSKRSSARCASRGSRPRCRKPRAPSSAIT